jgi:hypothetical protein
MASMVGGLDLHRRQITFEFADVESGELWRGKLWQPNRQRFRRWLTQDVAVRANGGRVELAVEGCTGWRFVVEEITSAGYVAHLAEPADTMAKRGRKRHAKTDRSDSGLLRQLLQDGDLPESWIPPVIILEWRGRIRLYKALTDQRTQWVQRIHAECYQHGVAVSESQIRTEETRGWLLGDTVELTVAARQRIATAYSMIHAVDTHAQPPQEAADQLRPTPARLPGSGRRSLRHRRADRGGGVVRARRLPSFHPLRPSRPSYRLGRDRRPIRSQSPQGISLPTRTRDAALGAVRGGQELLAPGRPDHDYYAKVKKEHDGKIAALSIARKLARRC